MLTGSPVTCAPGLNEGLLWKEERFRPLRCRRWCRRASTKGSSGERSDGRPSVTCHTRGMARLNEGLLWKEERCRVRILV